MKKKIENYYGRSLRRFLKIVNPIKKLFIATDCEVHVFINYYAVELLKKHGYKQEYRFFAKYLKDLDKVSVWADQDFKSVTHFYNPHMKRGLFGHKNSLDLTMDYYNIALRLWQIGKKNDSMFYLGACVHIIQDLTISQHVKIRLLNGHRQYENYVKYTHDLVNEYVATESPICLKSPEAYVEYNAMQALRIEEWVKKIPDIKHQYYHKTLYTLPLAQRTTAGCLLLFMHDAFTNFEKK